MREHRIFGAKESAVGASESMVQGRYAERSGQPGKREVSRHRDSQQIKNKESWSWALWVIPLLLWQGWGYSAVGRERVTMSEDKTTWPAKRKWAIG